MFFRKMIGLGIFFMLFLAVMGLFGGARSSRYESAWTQGYIAGQQSVSTDADGATTAPPPVVQNAYGVGRSHMGGFFFPGAFLFMCLLPFFLIGGLFFLFSFGGRRHWKHGRKHWRHHGHHPPWAGGDDEEWGDEPVMKA